MEWQLWGNFRVRLRLIWGKWSSICLKNGSQLGTEGGEEWDSPTELKLLFFQFDPELENILEYRVFLLIFFFLYKFQNFSPMVELTTAQKVAATHTPQTLADVSLSKRRRKTMLLDREEVRIDDTTMMEVLDTREGKEEKIKNENKKRILSL